MTNELMELLDRLGADMTLFRTEAVKGTNKAAAVRARKAAMRLRKDLKQYSKLSIK